jgi:peptide/nickel transport system substrate-binding protein
VTISTFNPNPLNISPGGKVSSKFTINIAPNASAGTNTIVIQGTDGSITHEVSLLLMVTNTTTPSPSTAPRCLIATATYGSELSPEVQLLRNFRDNAVEKSKAGSSFLILFNAWYYSFSPYIADYIANHEIARVGMKFVLYPLIAFVYAASKVYEGLHVSPDSAILASGLVASSLIGGFYVGLPFGLLNRRFRLTRKPNIKIPGSLLFAAISAVIVGQIFSSTLLLMVSSPLIVLIAMLLSANSTARLLSRNQKNP